MTNTEPLTDDMIQALREEAAAHGDTDQIAVCDLALDGVEECCWDVAHAINAARAMDDSKPFVRVICVHDDLDEAAYEAAIFCRACGNEVTGVHDCPGNPAI